MSDSEEETSNVSLKVDEIVDSKRTTNGSVEYKVRWVSFSWVSEEYLASSSNLIKSFLSKRQAGNSNDAELQSQNAIGSDQKLHLKLQNLQNKLDAEYDSHSRAKKRRHGEVDENNSKQEISTNAKAIDDLNLQVQELQKKLDTECKNRSELVQILSKLLLSDEKKEIQAQQNIESIQVNREAIQSLKNEVDQLRNQGYSTEIETNYRVTRSHGEENYHMPFVIDQSGGENDVLIPDVQDHSDTEEVESEHLSDIKQDNGKSDYLQGIKKARKRSLIRKHYPKRSQTSFAESSGGSNCISDQTSDISSEDSILYLPGPVVNTKTALDFNVKGVLTEEDFHHHAEQISPQYGQLVSYRCELDKGMSRVLLCFIKKSPNNLEVSDSNFDLQKYSENYLKTIHSSVTNSMQSSLRSLGFLSNDSPTLEIEPIMPLSQSTESIKTNELIFKAILNSQGPLVTKQSCRDGLCKIRPPVTSEDFIHHAELLSPDCGQLVRYHLRSRELVCFIKKHPEEIINTDIDLHRYTKRFFSPIHSCITPLMQMKLKEQGFISAELISKSQESLSTNMGTTFGDNSVQVNDESLMNESSAENESDIPLPSEPNEDIVKSILNAQGPIVSFRSLKITFKRLKGVTGEEFLAHCRLLSPDYGQLISYRSACSKGKSPISKCFIKKPPHELSGTDMDLKRYSKRYYAPVHSNFTPAMLMTLKSLGHISEDALSRTGIFSPLTQKEAASTEDDQVGTTLDKSNIEKAKIYQEQKLLQAVAHCDDV